MIDTAESIASAPAREPAPVTKSEAAAASSHQARINIPLNLAAWKDLPQTHQDALLWFHQHALDDGLTLNTAGQALNYDKTTIWRILKGTYEGNWDNVVSRITSYRKLTAQRENIQKNEFVENRFTKLIGNALTYALANSSITLIVGDSRFGKTTTARWWRDGNNHGRSVLVTAPAYGGTRGLLNEIAHACGYNTNKGALDLHQLVLKAFNRNRILIVDEAHRLMPGDKRVSPVSLEMLRDIHDRTGCALALIATARFQDQLAKSNYMFEQLIGRIGMPVRLPREIKPEDFLPIVRQYVKRPGDKVTDALALVVNEAGRLGVLVETLKVAARLAKNKKEDCRDEHVIKAIAIRREMMGETMYARKEAK
jgi:DNA transposition AAA+ family ATPase